jgi:hypothetical protein
MSEQPETLFPPMADAPGHGSNWLVAVIDTPRAGARAVKALQKDGFKQQDILLLSGPEALKRMAAKDEQRGPMGWAFKAVARVATDATYFQDMYTREAEEGHSIISIHTADPDAIEHARDILVSCGARHLKHFGPWTITDLSEPESPASPEP